VGERINQRDETVICREFLCDLEVGRVKGRLFIIILSMHGIVPDNYKLLSPSLIRLPSTFPPLGLRPSASESSGGEG